MSSQIFLEYKPPLLPTVQCYINFALTNLCNFSYNIVRLS